VSWPRAGGDGSLEQRLEEHRGRLRAKTGTLRGVSSLAGLVRTADGRPVAFAMLVNARPDGAPVGPWLVDRLTDALISSLDRLSPKDD
jgi:D-alanyl-D-alanine carboxypeptidase/D-alanyl-D-alanine-endopeptidase (penicillin-binding protein 4)